MHQRFLIFLCALGLLTLASCSESKHPLSAIEDAERDERLVGVWVAKDIEKGGGDIYLHIGAEAIAPISPEREKPEPALMRFVYIGHNKDFGRTVVESISGRFFISKVGDERYANVLFEALETDKPAFGRGYKFMAYIVEDDRLTIWFADGEPFEKAIKDGALAGKIVQQADKQGKFKIDVAKLTATSEELTAFLKTDAGRKVFEHDGDDGKLTLRRLR